MNITDSPAPPLTRKGFAVEARDVTKVFGEGATGVEALRGVDLTVSYGEFVAVMGPSGSGKSTLLHLIGGLEPPSSGSIRVGGRDLAALNDEQITLMRRRQIGFVFQTFNLLDVLNAAENVALPLIIDGVSESQAQGRAERILTLVGIGDRRRHQPRALSGGEQQRVAIARGLVTEPLLLLADEPTGNLDSNNGDLIMRLLRRLVDEHGHTILMVTHDARNAAMADRILILRDGRIMEEQSMPAARATERVLADLESHS